MAPPHMTPARLEAIVAQAAALQGDLVVLLGDYAAGMRFVSGRVAPAETARILATLRAPLGTWAVLGNHDWADDPVAQERGHGPTVWHAALQEAGIPVLENQAVRLAWQGPAVLAGRARVAVGLRPAAAAVRRRRPRRDAGADACRRRAGRSCSPTSPTSLPGSRRGWR